MAEGTPRISARIEHKKTVSRALCSAVMELTFESLEESATKAGLHVVQAWKAPRGEGFKAVAARFIVDGEDVLIVAFRGTRGKEEWLEYPTKWLTERFIAHPGFPGGSELQVFGVFSLALDEVWKVSGDKPNGPKENLSGLIWRQLNAGNRVVLAGHSKGGAVATTASSRLLLGDSSVGDEEEKADPAVRRPGPEVLTVRGGPLSRLSVFTFNAPMALSAPLADLYDAKMAEVRARESEEDSGGGLIGKLRGKIRKLRGRGGQEEEEEEEEEEDEGEDHQHVRFEHKADQVRKLPPTTSMRHVGARKWEGSRVVEDNKGVYMGAAIVTAGVVVGAGVATFAAGKKIVRAH